MRIAQIITVGHELYGAQKHVLDLATAFQNDGDEVLVIVGSTGVLDVACDERNIPWRHAKSLQRPIKLRKDLKACREIKAILKEFKPDVVASHSSKAGFISRWVCYRLGIPNTFTAHGFSFEEGVPFVRRKIYKTIERAVGLITNKIIAVSNLGKQLALKHKIVSERKLAMIHYGTPDTGVNYKKNKQPTFTMSMVARFREQKDHTTLIHALNGLKDREWQMFFLGDGPMQSELEELVQQFGLSDKIYFEGLVDNVPDYLAKTDLLVLITNWEGLPISTLEGLTFSLPVVASDVSGVREQVVHEYNGLLVRQGDVADVQQALAKIMDHPELLDKYGKNSRQLYLEHFTDEVMIQNTKALYESLVLENAKK